MTFITNKYTKWYNNIIRQAQIRTDKIQYSEKHHIIPQSLGGTNQKENLIVISPREHFICHWLLTKITIGQDKAKMMFALFSMKRENKYQKRYNTKITSRVYERIRISLAKLHLPSVKKGKTYEEMYGAIRAAQIRQSIKEKRINQIITSDTCAKKSISMLGKNKGIKFTEAHKTKLRATRALQIMKPWSEESKQKMRVPKPIISCPHCGKKGGAPQMKQWHFNNCKENNAYR